MTKRPNIVLILVVVLAVLAGVGLYWRAASPVPAGLIAVAGDVRAEENIVRAPVVTAPTPDYTVGVTSTPSPASRKRTATTSRGPVVAGYLATMTVVQGARVTTGQVLAQLDTTMLDLGVASAEAGAKKARAQLDVLENGQSKLLTAHAKLLKARSTLKGVRASVSTTLTVLTKTRAGIEASITAITAIIAQPGGPPPHIPPYPVLLAALRTADANLTAGITGIRGALRTIDSNLAKIAKGLSTMDSAIQQLRGTHDLLEANISAQDAAVALAKARRATATVTAPCSGVVTFARMPGTTVMVGAPLVRIRPDKVTYVDTYLTPAQITTIRVGSDARVSYDSASGGALTGHVAVIGDHAVIPPTNFPTAIVHMTRAVRVTIEVDGGQTAPPGTPVDVLITETATN